MSRECSNKQRGDGWQHNVGRHSDNLLPQSCALGQPRLLPGNVSGSLIYGAPLPGVDARPIGFRSRAAGAPNDSVVSPLLRWRY